MEGYKGEHEPTPRLRFVERDEPGELLINAATGESFRKTRKARVLQQLWRSPWQNVEDEWRDVPLSLEDATNG